MRKMPVEYIVGKEKNADDKQFPLFPQCLISLMIGHIRIKCYFNRYGHIMEVSDAHVFPGFLTPVPT